MCGGWSQGRGRPLPETFPIAQCLRPDTVLGTAGHSSARPHPHLPSGPSSQECPGWGLWVGSSCWHLLAQLAEKGPWPADALDMFWCPGLGVSRRGFISNQDHLSRVNCLHHGW